MNEYQTGQDPFSGTTALPIDDEVQRQIQARRQNKAERERARELERLQQQREARRTRKREQDRNRRRAQYDWPAWLIEAVSGIADREGVNRSQASAFLMRLAIQAYEQGMVDLEPYKRPSHNMRWDWELEIPAPDGHRDVLDLSR